MKKIVLALSLSLLFFGIGFVPFVHAQDKVFTLEELAQFDGKDGRPAYYAYEGKVYDVSASPLWKLGMHFGHSAGKDLTGKLEGAPHGDGIVKAMPLVGTLKDAAAVTASSPSPAASPAMETKTEAKSTARPWYQAPIRIFGISILGWTGILLGIVFVANFATCFALPWSKFPLPWHGLRPGPDPMDTTVQQKWANIHKYFAWATVVIGIIHGVIGLLQVWGFRL
jgi:predicted heme/steroid binding protein